MKSKKDKTVTLSDIPSKRMYKATLTKKVKSLDAVFGEGYVQPKKEPKPIENPLYPEITEKIGKIPVKVGKTHKPKENRVAEPKQKKVKEPNPVVKQSKPALRTPKPNNVEINYNIEADKLKVKETPLRNDYLDACLLKSALQSEINSEIKAGVVLPIKPKDSALARTKKRFGFKAKTREECVEQLNALIKKLQSRVKDSNRRKQSKLIAN
jgi:hypothetical protein